MRAQEKKKLTLRLNKQLIEQAKKYAARHNLSVSELVETYFRNLKDAGSEDHSPLVHQLTGLLPESVDAVETYHKHLLEKYGQ